MTLIRSLSTEIDYEALGKGKWKFDQFDAFERPCSKMVTNSLKFDFSLLMFLRAG